MIITFSNPKGGVGKTTTAVTLAHLLQQRGHEVALVDLDSWRARGAGGKAAYRRAELLGIPTYETLEAVPEPEPEVLLIDTPPNLSSDVQQAALRVADLVILPLSVSDDDLEVTLAHYQAVPHERKALLLTRIHPRSNSARYVEDLSEAGYQTLRSVIRSYGVYTSALTAGGTVAGIDTVAGRKATRDYEALLEELLSL